MAIRWAKSANKHLIEHEDALNAILFIFHVMLARRKIIDIAERNAQ